MISNSAAFYDEMWERYGSLDAVSPASFHRRRLVRKLALHRANRATTALDAGCGRGELLVDLARVLPGARLFGGDVSAESRRRAAVACPAAHVLPLDLESDDFLIDHANLLETFDLVVCSEVLEHLEQDRLAAARLHGLLAPGGVVIVTVPGGKKSRFDELIGHRRHYTKHELELLLTTAGLRVETLWAWGFPFHNLYRTAVRVASRFAFDEGGPPNQSTPGFGDRAYEITGRVLKPLYYMNRKFWGEQLIAVARKA